MSGVSMFALKFPSFRNSSGVNRQFPLIKKTRDKKSGSVMTMLMMLAFLIEQVSQLCCKVCQKAHKHVGTLGLFEKVRNHIDITVWGS